MDTIENKSGYEKGVIKPVIVNNLKSCKRLFTRVLSQIQTGDIQNDKAKLLIYGLSNFVSLYKDVEFDIRLTELENKIKGN